MLYQIAYRRLVHSVEDQLLKSGFTPGLGKPLVDLHLDERFYVMPVSVNLAAQERIIREESQHDELIERLAKAVDFEDL